MKNDCTDDGPDRFEDLLLHFDTKQVIAALGPVQRDDVLVAELTGQLLDGTPIEGADVVWIRGRGPVSP